MQRKIYNASRDLILNIVGLMVDRAAPDRKQRVVKTANVIQGPAYTDACVAVCCRRLQRYLIDLKQSLKWSLDVTTGLYILNYQEYRNFPDAVSDLTAEAV